MSSPRPRTLLLVTATLLVACGPRRQAGAEEAPKPVARSKMVKSSAWKSVDQLVDEEKYEEASREVAKIRAEAKAAGRGDEVAYALIREVQLRTALGAPETAVRFLRDETWPRSPFADAALQLFYGHSLINYLGTYGWEIDRRERVDTKGVVDLKAWTRPQLVAEARRAYQALWRERQRLGGQEAGWLGEFVEPNSFPRQVRGTFRDVLTYLAVDLLADTANWRPEESNELFRLDFRSLLVGGKGGGAAIDDDQLHPLVRLCGLLDDLEAWHRAEKRPAAALEARLERLRRLGASFTDDDERSAIRGHLAELLPAYRQDPWWAMGMAELAELHRRSGDLITARQLALDGEKAYPGSPGGKRCRHLVATIEGPDYQLAGMASDRLGQRSLRLQHRNLKTVFFRAYRQDLLQRIDNAKDYNLLPAGRELEALLAGRPAVEWQVDLPATPDFRSHDTFVNPPLAALGLYAIFASARPDFGKGDNRVVGVNFIVSDLVVLQRSDRTADHEVIVLGSAGGQPVAGAEVMLYRHDYRRRHQRVDSKVTDGGGAVRFDAGGHEGSSHFVVVRRGADLTLDGNSVWFGRPERPEPFAASLLYTDRSIYRPQQSVHFKVIAYRGDGGPRLPTLAKESRLTITLHDANGEEVARREVTTNAFGSASGRFEIPAGRLLGAWQLRSSTDGSAAIRVEEYKRPTFEVTIKDPEGALRLNQPAKLKGEARYYFGLPVTSGKVRWRVRREAVFPWWWGWFYRHADAGSQLVASGDSRLEADGSFAIAFTPAADERKATAPGGKEITYRYTVSADFTDEGGETRSAERGFRLGFVAVEASIGSERNFQIAGQGAELAIGRQSLDGVPRPGKGSYRLVALERPARALLPAELPQKGDAKTLLTPGDRLRPRWEREYDPLAVIAEWKDGREVAAGELVHDAKGQAKLPLGQLAPGAYRIRYRTVDEFGTAFETWKDHLVVASTLDLPIAAALTPLQGAVKVGDTARLLVHSGFAGQPLFFDRYRDGRLLERRRLQGGAGSLVEIPITEEDRGGFAVALWLVRDHQLLQFDQSIFVPWDNKELKVELSTFRDKLRPGAKETWRVTVKAPSGKLAEKGAAEVLAYMYDRSLDVFAPHSPPSPLSLFPSRLGAGSYRAAGGEVGAQWLLGSNFPPPPDFPGFSGDRLKFYDGYSIGGMGRRRLYKRAPMRMAPGAMPEAMPPPAPPAEPDAEKKEATLEKPAASAVMADASLAGKNKDKAGGQAQAPAAATPVRQNFAETAFFQPHLLTDDKGSATIEFQVPDSVTSWNVWIHALTRDLASASLQSEARSIKDLMVRPYLPRFFREGDRAALKVVVNNASERELKGQLQVEIFDPETKASLLKDFAVGERRLPFAVKAGGGTNLTIPVVAPRRIGPVAFQVTASSGDLSDGELRPLPVLPSRLHLAQSRFVSLRDQDRRTMTFADMQKGGDPTLTHDALVVTLDAQLFYGVLKALPYLVEYPYECTEQTMNRFVSTGIVSSVYRDYPAVAKMAAQLAKRDTPLETFDGADPNRKLALEESPWLAEAKGGSAGDLPLVNVLDPRIAKAHRDEALGKLQKAQTSLGGFPWFPGGPPSPYMTLYLLFGFAKAQEFGVEIPNEMVQRGWQYLARHFRDEYASKLMKKDCCWEFLTLLNYTASAFPEAQSAGAGLTAAERKQILDFSFKHWKRHSPYLKSLLALTLKRAGREADGRLVFASVMDSAKTRPDEGTFWQPEDRSWLWYNDTIESHAWALRTLLELAPEDKRQDGLVLWLFLNKKLNHWKSTRATAEVIYSLVHYLKRQGALGVKEEAKVAIGPAEHRFTFAPEVYVGKAQVVVPGPEVVSSRDHTITVDKSSRGVMFASATWHFSTDQLPTEARGDFFQVSRRYFRRDTRKAEATLSPLAEGATLEAGDEVEVQLSLRAKQAAEYVHLRDPRAAGLEPDIAVSRWKWDLGIAWYEEIRDSGTNFFFEQLPAGEYTFKYRLRANLGGTFRVGPATVQSMYAPEFTAYSQGHLVTIGANQK